VRPVSKQADLFFATPPLPSGLRYQSEFLGADCERALLAQCAGLPFKAFEFRGFQGKRRVVSFGWRYDFNGGGLQKADDIPAFLLRVRDKAAAFAQIAAANLQQALVTEYRPGAAIGWHQDRSVFGDVIGLSLRSACMFRLRRRIGANWQRASLSIEPRSIYLLRGASRKDWEHSIPPVSTLRYSVTFRSLLPAAGRPNP
jgi:alkylated DNA repair dioxygenase AlkB